MLIYIWFRFELQFGLGAVAALFHDVFLTFGLIAILQIEFNLTAVAAILTIIGYSMNDTVVVFDRFRENLRKYKRMPLAEVIDMSINEMLTRTIITSMTAVLALIALAIFGGPSLYGAVGDHAVRHRDRHLFVDLHRRAGDPALGRQAQRRRRPSR